jgi:FtsX-like permease family
MSERSRASTATARYRFPAMLRRRWRQYLVLALTIALLGGTAMASIEFARRTQSSYPAYLQETDASDLTLSTYGIGGGGATLYSPATERAIARLPAVAHVESWAGVFAVPIDRSGAPELSIGNEVNFAGSETGLYFHMDRVHALEGRVADPDRVDEFMTSPLGAKLLGVRVGQVIPVGLYTNTQSMLPGFGTASVPPAKRFAMKLVGIVQFNNQVIEDDTDRLPTNAVYTPAFTHQVPDVDTNGTWYGIQLRPHAGSLASVENELRRALPTGATANFSVTSQTESKVERAVEPESIALGVFGLIAALACVVTGLLLVGREIQESEPDREVLRALGAAPIATLVDPLLGTTIAIVVGTALASALAVVLSPIAPLGPIHDVFDPGVTFDWTVVGGGIAVFGGLLIAGSLLIAALSASRRSASHVGRDPARASQLAQAASGIGCPVPMTIGLRFALEAGRGRTAGMARSVLIGAVVALTTVAATLTFGNSLTTLVTHPELYGWNWTYALGSQQDVPPAALKWLDHSHDVAAWSGYNEPNLQVDGQSVPALTTSGTPAVGPPLLSGSGVKRDTVVLGSSTLAALHTHVGGTVSVGYGTPNLAPLYLPPIRATVSGTATFPSIAGSTTFAEHIGLGVGALVSSGVLPAKFLRAVQSPDPVLDGPALVFVKMRPNVSRSAAERDMQDVVNVAGKQFATDRNAAGDGVTFLAVQRPAEIVNYQATGDTPIVLAAALGAGATLVLLLVLAGTVRQRRMDLAVLKTMGFTRRQLVFTLTWQAATVAVVGIVIGIPLGIAVGRVLWDLFARNIGVVPAPTVPYSVAVVAVGTLVLAVVVALLPGRKAASTPAGVVLREE